MEIRPIFSDDFACLADRCRHTCCKEGWEIDVDEDTRRIWTEEETPIGASLRENLIQQADGTWSIRLQPDGVCPHLNRNGLCKIILCLGEYALCDICALHPRFYEDIGLDELSGQGLCCEEAVGLLLATEGDLTFLDEEDHVLTLAEVMDAVHIPHDALSLPYNPRIDASWYQTIFHLYGKCESLNEEWPKTLARLSRDPDAAASAALTYWNTADRQAFQRIFTYILYRQLEFAEAYGVPALLRFAQLNTDFVLLWAALDGDLPERLRCWSAEMEYSTDNVDLLLEGAAALEGP